MIVFFVLRAYAYVFRVFFPADSDSECTKVVVSIGTESDFTDTHSGDFYQVKSLDLFGAHTVRLPMDD